MAEKKGLLSLATEKIDKYGDFTIIVANENEQVSVAKLCCSAKDKKNKHKGFKHWLSTNRSCDSVNLHILPASLKELRCGLKN
jgi:uncharacterized protein YjfI (DUF2170 family)